MKELGLLQTELKNLIQDEIFGDQILLKTNKGDVATIIGYEQALPIKLIDDGNAEEGGAELAPYFLLRIEHITTDDREEPKDVTWHLYFCTYDNAADNQGHKDILLLFGRFTAYLQKHPMLLESLYVSKTATIDCELPDEDTWPYFFGGVSFTTQIQNEGVEDDNI